MFYFLSWYCQLWLSCCFLLVNSSFKFSPFDVVLLGEKKESFFFFFFGGGGDGFLCFCKWVF